MNMVLNIKGKIADVSDEELIEKTRDAHKLCESAHDECESLELARRLERIKLNLGFLTKGKA